MSDILNSIEVDSQNWITPEILLAAEKLREEHSDCAVIALLTARIPFPQAYAAVDAARRNRSN